MASGSDVNRHTPDQRKRCHHAYRWPAEVTSTRIPLTSGSDVRTLFHDGAYLWWWRRLHLVGTQQRARSAPGRRPSPRRSARRRTPDARRRSRRLRPCSATACRRSYRCTAWRARGECARSASVLSTQTPPGSRSPRASRPGPGAQSFSNLPGEDRHHFGAKTTNIQKVHSLNLLKRNCMSGVVRIGRPVSFIWVTQG